MTDLRTTGCMYLGLTLFMLANMHGRLYAQQTPDGTREELNEWIMQLYGPDQHLVNGIEYANLHLRSEGHKFLDEDRYYPGRVIIDGKAYDDVSLKYDIFNQHLILLVPFRSGGHKQIILNNMRIEGFELNGRVFRKYTFPKTGTRFYQVIGSEQMACLYHFSKQEISNPVDNYTLSKFSEVQKKSYLYWQSALHEFKGKRSFVRIFPEHQPEIRAFIRKNRFRVRKLNDTDMNWLIYHCYSLAGNPDEE
jgi:hypothetical protein